MEDKQISNEMQLLVHRKLVENDLISPRERIKLKPHHTIILAGEFVTHYIITCTQTNLHYFLKRVKGVDGMILCDPFLNKQSCYNSSHNFSQIVVPPFEFAGEEYYILNYIEGYTLDELPIDTPYESWERIANQLCDQIDYLAAIQAPEYSDQGKFVSKTYAEIMKGRFCHRMQHSYVDSLPGRTIQLAAQQCFEILDGSCYSNPSLLHMDIKPANIIYNPKTDTIALIDFESSRFGDLDFWWIQIFLSQWNYFNRPYREIIAPKIISQKLNENEIFGNEKLQCYLFYQTLCNEIYYHDLDIPCPEKMDNLFHSLMDELSRRYI